MRAFGRGLVAGFVLSLVRVPLGIDLVQWPAVSGEEAYGFRALALAVVALGVGIFVRSHVALATLFGAAAGYALHGLVLADTWSLDARWSLWLALVLGLAALIGLRERSADLGPGVDPSTPSATGDPAITSEAEGEHPATLLEMIGLTIAGAGLAIAIEAVARHVRLFGAGERQDDSVFGAVFLSAVAIGALAFGWVGRSRILRRAMLPVTLALAAVSTYASLHVIATMTDNQGLNAFLKTYGLSAADHGTLAYDALIAGSLFVLPAFLLGTGVSSTRGSGRILSVLLGASLGLFYVCVLLASNAESLATEKSLFSAELVPIGTLIAAAGAALALVASKELGAAGRWIGLACAIGAACAPLAIATRPIILMSPWRKWPVMPFVTLDTPSGLLTVEPSAGGLKLVTLDRRELTPRTESSNADSKLLREAVELMPPADRAHEILLVGQMTPVRWAILSKAGVARADRCGAWHASMERVEKELFGESERPPGDMLAPDEARARLAEGRYALVLAPPVEGDAPLLDSREVPERTVLVAWFPMERGSEIWSCAAPLVAAGGLDEPVLGAVLHAKARTPGPREPLVVAAGDPVECTLPIERLRMRTQERTDRARADWARRLSRAARGTPHEKLVKGLELFYADQARSSPFETKDEQIELPNEALDELLASALDEPDNAFIRSLWERIASILAGKRRVEDIYRYLTPLAERFSPPPWPMLEKALAHADLESFEPERAASRLAPLAEAEPGDFGLWYYLGIARSQSGDHAGAAASWKRALALRPDHEPTQKKLATALVRIGDPSGRRRIAELVERHPEDLSLRAFLGDGPFPEVEPGYTPETWADGHRP